MYKILFLNPDNGHTCSFYRSGGVIKDLRHKLGGGFDVEVKAWRDVETDWQGIYNYDIVMMQRPYTAQMLDYGKHVKQMNVKLWLDYDDNLLTVTPENRVWPLFSDPKIQSNIKEFYGIADYITVATKQLKEDIEPLNSNISIIPNAFNDSIFNIDRVIDERRDIVFWRGSDSHIYDVMSYTKSITGCVDTFKDTVFLFMGFHPWYIPANKNVVYEKPRDIISYFDYGLSLKPRAVHVPLHDTDFNRCKSNIAFIEGSYFGAACLVPEFWEHLPGTLTYTDNESYLKGLTSLLDGSVDIAEMNNTAWDYIKENLLLSEINKQRVEVINKLLLN